MDSHAIVISDREGKIQVWSPGAERLFGHRAGDALGQSLDLIVPPKFRERHWTAFHAAMKSGQPKIHDVGTQLPVVCADGSTKTFPARFLFLRDGKDRAIGAMAIYSDPEP